MDYLIKNFINIKNNEKEFIEKAKLAHERFIFAYGKPFNQTSSTWFYRHYNFTTLTAGCPLYYKFFKDLKNVIRKFSKHKKPLWYQCWLNFHKQSEVLKWHNHENSSYHGYVSIDPKNTETQFSNYTIKNEVGKMYIGKSYQKHQVNVLTPYEGNRITIAFDVFDEKDFKRIYKEFGKIDINTGFIPI